MKKAPAKMKKSPAKMAKKAPAKMMKKSPAKKALVGKQKNLPKELKDKILASPAKMLKPAAMKLMKKDSPAKKRTVIKGKDAQGRKTKDVIRVSRSGNKVTVKNKTKGDTYVGKPGRGKTTTRSRVVLSNDKGRDDFKLKKGKTSTRSKSGGTTKSRAKGANATSNMLKGKGMRNYKDPRRK